MQLLEKIDKNIDSIKLELETLNDKIKLEKEIFKCLKEDFLRLITDETIGSINQFSNDMLHLIPNGSSFNIMLDITKLSKNNKIKKEINLKLYKNGKEIRRVSGGENCSINMAVDLAISKIISMRGNKVFNWIIFDESFDGMSTKNKNFALQIMQGLSKDKLIILVEHTTEIAEGFDQVIFVKNDGQGSLIE